MRERKEKRVRRRLIGSRSLAPITKARLSYHVGDPIVEPAPDDEACTRMSISTADSTSIAVTEVSDICRSRMLIEERAFPTYTLSSCGKMVFQKIAPRLVGIPPTICALIKTSIFPPVRTCLYLLPLSNTSRYFPSKAQYSIINGSLFALGIYKCDVTNA